MTDESICGQPIKARKNSVASVCRLKPGHNGACRSRTRRESVSDKSRIAALARTAERLQVIRSTIFAYYGEECTCCRSTQSLTIDHVNGDGAEHRKNLPGGESRSGLFLYRWLIDNDMPSGFQTLCNRCNSSKKTGTACQLDHSDHTRQCEHIVDRGKYKGQRCSLFANHNGQHSTTTVKTFFS